MFRKKANFASLRNGGLVVYRGGVDFLIWCVSQKCVFCKFAKLRNFSITDIDEIGFKSATPQFCDFCNFAE